jgi:hypothetical protein
MVCVARLAPPLAIQFSSGQKSDIEKAVILSEAQRSRRIPSPSGKSRDPSTALRKASAPLRMTFF